MIADAWLLRAIHPRPVIHFKDQDDDLFVTDFGEGSVITNAVTPEA